MFNVLKIN